MGNISEGFLHIDNPCMESIRRSLQRELQLPDELFEVRELTLPNKNHNGKHFIYTTVLDMSPSLIKNNENINEALKVMFEEVQRNDDMRASLDISILAFSDTVKLYRDFGHINRRDVPPVLSVNAKSRTTALYAAMFVALYRGERRKEQYYDLYRSQLAGAMGDDIQNSPVEYFQPIVHLSTDYAENAKIMVELPGSREGDPPVMLESVVDTILREKMEKGKMALFLGKYGDHNMGNNKAHFERMLHYGSSGNRFLARNLQMTEVADQYRWILQNLKNTISEQGSDFETVETMNNYQAKQDEGEIE